MATVTTPDSIVAHDDSDGFDTSAAYAALASSVQDAFDNRQNYDFLWVNAAARTAQTGMVTMSMGFQQDTKAIYIYNGTAWKLWATNQPVAFTPAWTNLTVGNSVQQASYSVAAGTVFVRGFITLGTTGSVGASPYMTAPLPLNGYITGAPGSGTDLALGAVTFVDAGTQGYPGVANTFNASSVIYVRPQAIGAGLAYATSNLISSTVPFTWGTGDYLTYNYSYQAD